MAYALTIAAIVMFICIAFNNLSERLGVPVLLAFIVLGMIFGADGLVKIYFDNFVFAEKLCSVALIFIMFYGGFGTKWSSAKPVAKEAVLLSTAGVVVTAGITALFCRFALKIPTLESCLIGSVISSTDAASVFSVLRSKRLNLKYNTASMLELESGSNDPFSYMLTMTVLSMMSGEASGGAIFIMLIKQVVIGVIFGAAISLAAVKCMKKIRFGADGFDTIFILAAAILAYALPSMLGGNGYLSTYIVGIVLGNSRLKNKKAMVNFFDGITGLMQMLIFFLLGLLAFPSKIPQIILPSLGIVLFLTFAARPLAVFAILTPFRCNFKQQLLVSWAGLRGAASIVFAVMAVISRGNMDIDLFHIVFFIALFSILVQGTLIPAAAKKLDMVDAEADVLKTFNDYVEEVPVQFIQFKVPEEHIWCGKSVKDILLPPDSILVLLQRNGEKIIPNGETVICGNDYLVLGAKAPDVFHGVNLTELEICEGNDSAGKTVRDIAPQPDKLVIMIQRNGEIIIPTGSTIIQKNDILVMNM